MENTLRTIIKDEKPALIEFINANCGPCEMMTPALQQVKNTVGKRINVHIVPVSDVEKITQEYHIEVVPTTVLFHKGEVLWQSSEVLSKQEIINVVLDKIDS